MYRAQWSKTKKYYDAGKKKAGAGGMFQIIIDPSKCKGCAECVTVCDDDALKMIAKTDEVMVKARKSHRYFKNIGPSNEKYINDNLLIDMMLKEQTHIYVGGAGSCAGCGEGTALRMLCSATGSKYGDQWGIVAATGCNTVYTSTYPYNPYLVPWTNSLFENAPADAIGVRMRWDQMGWQDKPIWCIGGDGAMFDIGFQALSRLFASGMNIKVFVLDTQVYSNTGGQASTASFTGQNTKMRVHGKAVGGKQERRKEIAQIAMMHPRTYVAQTTCAHVNHFYKSVLGALEFDGPAIVVCYTTCQPEHGVADNMAGEQARLAVDTRAFPLLIYDPAQGRHGQGTAVAAGQPGREGRLVRQSRRRRRKSPSSTSPAARAGSPSTSTRTATRRRRCCTPSRTGWRTGICCRNWLACDRAAPPGHVRLHSGRLARRPGVPETHTFRAARAIPRARLEGPRPRHRRQQGLLRGARHRLPRCRRHSPAAIRQHRVQSRHHSHAYRGGIQGIRHRPPLAVGARPGDVVRADRGSGSASDGGRVARVEYSQGRHHPLAAWGFGRCP